MSTKKDRLTITIDSDTLKKFKKICKERHLTVSGVIQNFIEFFVNPQFYCFECGEPFDAEGAQPCPKCSWMICPNCGVCGCSLDEDIIKAIFQMRKTFEDLKMGRVK